MAARMTVTARAFLGRRSRCGARGRSFDWYRRADRERRQAAAKPGFAGREPQPARSAREDLDPGAAGVGEGHAGEAHRRAYGVPHVATGDILRSAVAADELGRRVAPILERGDLVPDDLMVDLIRERLAEENGYVLDGFPRTVPAGGGARCRCSTRSASPSTPCYCSGLGRRRPRAPASGAGGGRARRRRAGRDPQPTPPVPRADRAGRRALPRGGDARRRRRRAVDRRGLRRDPGRPRRMRRAA